MYELRAKSKKETDMLMYGSISEWGRVNAEGFIRALLAAKASSYEKINLRFHSPGGSIFEGLAIISQMHAQGIEVHGFVDGIACSMASAILVSCNKAYMVKGTRLMIHQGSGGVFGSASQIRNYADLLASLNGTLADLYARKTKKESKWILDNWMAEGKDTWFTAEQALKEGLIDGIVEGSVKPLPQEKENASLYEMAAHYDQFCKDTTESDTMNKEQLIKLLGLNANATEAEIEAALTALKAKAEKAPADNADQKKDAPAGDQSKKDASAADQNTVIDGIAALAKERGMKDEQIEAVKKLAATDVKSAMALIPAATEKTDTNGGTLNLNELITALKGGNGGASSKEDRKSWKYSDWQKNDSNGLLAMGKDKPEEFAKLYAAEHGYTPSVDEVKKLVA
jgi:ATP-dependent Clp endopeptidase proteolytic subunit ClpP